MSAKRCADPTCSRFVRASEDYCRRHRLDADAVVSADRHTTAPDEELADVFRERLERGQYRGLFDLNVQQVIDQAAAQVTEHGLIDELGALRMVLARILLEEQDLSRMVTNVTRVASVAVRAAQAQRVISGQAADGLTDALTTILVEVNAAKP